MIPALTDRFVRPSSIEQLDACNGAAQLQAAVAEQMGEAKETPLAAMGTSVNAFVDQGIALWLSGDHTWEVATERAVALASMDLDSWSVRCVRSTIEFYRSLIEKYEIEAENVLVQHGMDLEAFGFATGKQGTADLVLVVPFKRVIIVDLKAGYLDQGDADEHDQMAVYACAAAATFRCHEVTCWLWQPRNDRDRRATATTFDAEALRATSPWIRRVVDAARNPDAELTASYQACKYCKALTVCPAAKEYAMRIATVLDSPIGPQSADEWGALADAAKVAAKLADLGVDLVKDHLKAGGQATGWGLTPGAVISKIEDCTSVLRIATEQGLLPMVMPALSVSASKLKTQFNEQTFDALFGVLVVERQNADSLKQNKRSKGAA